MVVWKRGDATEAYKSFAAAVAADPRLVSAMHQLASLDIQAGRHANALAWVDRILAIVPGDQRAMTLRVKLVTALP